MPGGAVTTTGAAVIAINRDGKEQTVRIQVFPDLGATREAEE